MTAVPDDRTMRQRDKDAVAIYAYLSTIATTQERHSAQLDELTEAQGQRTATLAGLAGVQAQHTATLDEHGAKLDRILEILERR
jgi:hypothetical protein